MQAWYPGQAGGTAIAEILTGKVNPSGHLPITFPVDLGQTPRPELPGLGTPWGTAVRIEYNEGAEVGYRWYVPQGSKPLYAFGHGLSYTTFDYKDLKVSGGETVTATFTVTNTGSREGADVPQVYLTEAPLYFLPVNESFATVPELERELRTHVDMALLRRIADASRQGRFLLVNTSDVDDGGSWVWDVGSEAQRAVESGNVERVHRILLASAGIPGAFPFRVIDGSLYVDGGVTGNILYGGGTREEQTLPAVWAAL